MKSIWITALAKEQVPVVAITGTASQYGLAADGHFWTDDLEKMAWIGVRDKLREKEIALWVIVGSAEDLLPETRYGLTLLYMGIRAERPDLSILWVDSGDQLDAKQLPTLLSGIPLVQVENAILGAKLAASANMTAKLPIIDYRLGVHANPGFGVWFEVGPAPDQEWSGAMLAINGGEIKAHGVGPAGQLPEKCVLEYPMQGMQLSLNKTEYSGWGVANKLDKNFSYFAKIDGVPSGFLFGPFAGEDEVNMHVVAI
uniref:hypothetical protein n=1 Tax=Candidatus Electrothrix sp. TaxID=2170559 RepID=UPI004057371F